MSQTLTELEQRVLTHIAENQPISPRKLEANPPQGLSQREVRVSFIALLETHGLVRIDDCLKIVVA
jgi:hypothetical protein